MELNHKEVDIMLDWFRTYFHPDNRVLNAWNNPLEKPYDVLIQNFSSNYSEDYINEASKILEHDSEYWFFRRKKESESIENINSSDEEKYDSKIVVNKKQSPLVIPYKKIVITIIVVFILIWFFHRIFNPLNVEVFRLKDGDSSVLWIKNKENKLIKLIEVEINNEYSMKIFGEEKDSDNIFLNYNLGRGKKFIKSNEEIELFTKYFSNKNGIVFNTQNNVIKKITVTAEVGSGIFSTRVHSGKFE